MLIHIFYIYFFDFFRENHRVKQEGMTSTQARETVSIKEDDTRIEMAPLLSSDFNVSPNNIRLDNDNTAIESSETIRSNQSGKYILDLSYKFALIKI